MDGARQAYHEALALAERVGMLPAQVELHAWLAQLSAYCAEWDDVAASTEASAELAEREGLVGKLCLPYSLRGLLLWREGRLEEATVLFHQAHELAEQVGWSEIAFQALFGLALALRDSGDYASAADTLDRAIDLCERAGLLAQSIQATAARAVVLALSQRPVPAREAAREAAELAERMHYPIGRAAALEARGLSAEDPVEGVELLETAETTWRGLGRPLEAARCRLMAGQRLVPPSPPVRAKCSRPLPRRRSAWGCRTWLAGSGPRAGLGDHRRARASCRRRRSRPRRRRQRAPGCPGRSARAGRSSAAG